MKTQKMIMTLLGLFITPVLVADYVITRSDRNILTRYQDDFTTVVWEVTLPSPITIRIHTHPTNLDLYGASGVNKIVRRIDRHTGTILEQGGGNWPRNDGMAFGYDYNEDGIPDLWTCQSHGGEAQSFTVWCGAASIQDPAEPLAVITVPNVSPNDGTGGRGMVFGPDRTGDGVPELYVIKGLNDSSNKLNVWDPVALKNGEGSDARIASYPAGEVREAEGMLLGPDYDGDGQQDLWIASGRNHRVTVYNYMTGAYLGNAFPNSSQYYPLAVKPGPRGTLLLSTRFATTLDPAYPGGNVSQNGGNVLLWDPDKPGTGNDKWAFLYAPTKDGGSDRIYDVEYLPNYAYNPDPANRATRISTKTTTLSWINPEGVLKCDLYFGTDPNARNGGTKVTISDPDVRTTVGIPAAYMPLQDLTDYYWLVNCYSGASDPNDPNNPIVPNEPDLPGEVWTFHTNNNLAPAVDVPDQYLWHGKDGDPDSATLVLTPVVIDDGLPLGNELTYQWTQLAGPAVTIDPDNGKDTLLVLTELSNDYQFQLTVSDGDLITSVTARVVLAADSCAASAQKPGFSYSLGDINQDCIVDLTDLMEMALDWLECKDLGGCNN